VNYFLVNAFLAFIWALLSGVFTLENLLIGFLLGYAVLFAARRVLGPTRYFYKSTRAAGFLLYAFYQILQANLKVAAEVLSPRLDIQPRILAVPVRSRTELELTLLVILISLTPGTLVIDISTDRRVLYIHHMIAPDPEAAIAGITETLERPLLSLLRGVPQDEKEETA
jgi:multicomponent Na+:H+ antiporter subunit E